MAHIKQTHEGYNGIYLERSGESARCFAELLVNEPELPLSSEQKQEAYDFDQSLYDHSLREGVSIASSIRNHKAEAVVAPAFFAHEFLQGTIDASVFGEAPDMQSTDDVYRWIATLVSNKTCDARTLRTVAKASNDAYNARMKAALLEGETLEQESLSAMAIVLDPDALIQTETDLRASREFLLSQRAIYKEGGDRLDGAKRALIDVYLSRVNGLLAAEIPCLDYVMSQADLIGDVKLKQKAQGALPDNLREVILDPKLRTSIFTRLDYLRNGMGIDAEGHASAVSGELSVHESAGAAASIFTPEQTERIKSTMMSPDEMVTFFENVLSQANMLSAEPRATWTADRRVRAHDELFQVVKNESGSTFGVDGVSGIFKVATTPRSLYDVMVTGIHELEHINQSQADRQLGKTLRISELKGKRVNMLREGGANVKQRQAEARLFGQSKPIVLSYANALRELEENGSLMAATRAFFETKRAAYPSMPLQNVAADAADRVQRLVREGGKNSQSMAYAEEGIFNDELITASPSARARAVMITSLDLVDQAKLHTYGLLPSTGLESIDWTGYVEAVAEPYIQAALTA